MSNGCPPWSKYRALMLGTLIGLDKCPGVKPVGVVENWWRIMAKCVLVVVGLEAKEFCRTEHICIGLEARIEGGIHTVRLLWQKHAQEEDWGFLLIDVLNAFNEEKLIDILWVGRFEWPSSTWFSFNYHLHWYMMVIMAGEGMGHFFFSKEGVTQRYPLMVLYGMVIFPLISEF